VHIFTENLLNRIAFSRFRIRADPVQKKIFSITPAGQIIAEVIKKSMEPFDIKQ